MKYVYTISIIIVLFFTKIIPCQAQLSEQDNAVKNNAYFYIQQQNYQQALATAKQLPDVYDKYLIMGLGYLNLDKLEEALQWIDDGLSQFPDSLKLSVSKVEILFFQQEYEQMLSVYTKLETKVNMQSAKALGFEDLTVKVAYVLLKLAQDAFHEKDFVTSEKQYRKALKYENTKDTNISFSQSIEVYLGLCLSLLEQEKWTEMITYAHNGLEKHPNQLDLMGLLANAYFKIGDYKNLQSVYTSIYEADDQNIQKAMTLGEVMMANKDFQAAQKHYNQLLERFPNKAEVYDAALQISSQYRDLDSRVAILKRKYNHIPTVETILLLAESYQLAKEWQLAVDVYDSLSIHADNPLPYYIELVKVYERSDSLELALPKLRRFSDEYPEEVTFGVAYLKALEKQNCKVKTEGMEHIQLIQNSKVLTQNAKLLSSCGKEEKAIFMLQRAIELESAMPEAFVMLTKMAMDHKDYKDSSFSYLAMASHHLLAAIETEEEFMKGLSLSDPFNPAWLELPAMSDQLEEHKEQLKEMIGTASRHFRLEETGNLLNELSHHYEDNALLMFLIGQHYAYHRQRAEAISQYKKAIEIEPELLQAQYEWARLSEKSKDENAAKMGYEKVLAIDDEYSAAYNGLIRLYRKSGDLNELTDRWELIYSNNRKNKVLKNALIEALHKQGRVEEAKTISQDE